MQASKVEQERKNLIVQFTEVVPFVGSLRRMQSGNTQSSGAIWRRPFCNRRSTIGSERGAEAAERKRRMSCHVESAEGSYHVELAETGYGRGASDGGVAVVAVWAATARAESVPANAVMQGQSTPVLRAGDQSGEDSVAIATGARSAISVSRVRPALILPQSTTRTVPQGTVPKVLPFQQGAAANQSVWQTGAAGALTSVNPQGTTARCF
jgi:hypothetical protein